MGLGLELVLGFGLNIQRGLEMDGKTLHE
jgi:hypothetical protein